MLNRLCIALIAFGAAVAPAEANPLKTAPLPVCGPVDNNFHRLFSALRQQEAWRGAHENGHGDIRLTVGKGGAWSMFYHTNDTSGVERVCVIARGHGSREAFGKPV